MRNENTELMKEKEELQKKAQGGGPGQLSGDSIASFESETKEKIASLEQKVKDL